MSIDGDDMNVAPGTESCSLRHQFILHSALDRLEELTAGNRWRAPGSVGSDAMWVGMLCPVDELKVYGEFMFIICFTGSYNHAYIAHGGKQNQKQR
eukprot:12798386-Ditylum_brightwellii.AAC.1